MVRLQRVAGDGPGPRDGLPRGEGMGPGRRRGWDPRGPYQHAGGPVDGLAELRATVPGSEQSVPVSVRGDVRVGLQRQAGDRGVRAGAVGCAVCHHLPYMSLRLLTSISDEMS